MVMVGLRKQTKECGHHFDKEDPLEWILIGFGIGALFVLTIIGVIDWIIQL